MENAKNNDLERGSVDKIQKDEGISFFDLFAVLWRRKKMIIAIIVPIMIGLVCFSVISIILPPETSPLPNVYTSRAFVLITEGRAPAGDRETLLGYGLRRGPTYGGLALFLLKSNTLLDFVIDDLALMGWDGYDGSHRPITREMLREGLEQSETLITRRMLRDGLGPSHDDNSGVLSISFTYINPVFARDVVNLTVSHLENRFIALGIDRNRTEQERLELHLAEVFQNILLLDEERRRLEQSVAFIPLVGGNLPAIMADIGRATMESEAMRQVYTQLRVQHEVLRATIATEIPMLQILELAEVPHERSGPSRAMICIAVSIIAVFFAMFLALVLEGISSIRNDPVAMAKLGRVNA